MRTIKTNNRILRAILFLLIAFAGSTQLNAQTAYKQTGNTSIRVDGTSTLHDWEMISSATTFEASFKLSPEGKPIQLDVLKLNIPSESLKSGKGSMDKNAYSSLKTDKFKAITFEMTTSKMEAEKIKCGGNLTIAGITQKIEIEATCHLQPNNSMQCKGEKELKMTDYKVEPPTFMMGTIKTGDAIKISFDVTLTPVKP